jgi:formylglycine-generating enzyme required for sulfatase activity
MAGEIWEWNLDWHATYVDPCTNCAYLTTASGRVVRGGPNGNGLEGILPPERWTDDPTSHYNDIGFRCARTP